MSWFISLCDVSDASGDTIKMKYSLRCLFTCTHMFFLFSRYALENTRRVVDVLKWDENTWRRSLTRSKNRRHSGFSTSCLLYKATSSASRAFGWFSLSCVSVMWWSHGVRHVSEDSFSWTCSTFVRFYLVEIVFLYSLNMDRFVARVLILDSAEVQQ